MFQTLTAVKTKTFFFLNVLLLATFALPAAIQAQTGTLTDETYNTSGSFGYTDASSIPVSSTDLLEGLTPISTNYVGTYEANGGNLGVLTDGSTGVGNNAASGPTNAAFDFGNGNWYAEYQLPSTTGGFTINSIVVTTGHQDNRVNQDYDILVSTNGTDFFSLSDGSTQSLGNAGGSFYYAPSTGAGGAAQSTVSPVGANLGTGIKYVEFVAEVGGADVYRELDVNGTAPEPTTWAELALGAGVLALIQLRRKTARR